MKKYFKFHFFFYIVSFILLLSGHFKPYIMIIAITLFHELGHIIMGKIFKWEILKIVILPFGCITYFKIDLNVKLKEEFLVTIMGPIFQMIGATIYYYFTKDDTFLFYNNILLLLNLIPIIPLDGSKIMQVLLFKLMSYRKTLSVSLNISLMLLILTFIYQIYQFNFLLLIWSILLLIENIKEKNIQPLKFYLFLKERYKNDYNFPYRYLNTINVTKIKRDYKTIFKNKYTEKEIINKYLSNKKGGYLFDNRAIV